MSLIEGYHLVILLGQTSFNSKSPLALYLLWGWVAPLFYVFFWAFLRSQFANQVCWEQYHPWIRWVVYGPKVLLLILNFYAFVHILKIVSQKLQGKLFLICLKFTSEMLFLGAENNEASKKLARSFLSLAPLLGIHYILTSFIPDNVQQIIPFWLYILKIGVEMILGGVQGGIVAMVYCFLNKEVQAELITNWKLWKEDRDMQNAADLRKRQSTTQSSSSSNHL